MLRLYSNNRKMDTVFVAALFVLFAITACLLILIGARQYRATAKAMNANYEVRTASSYLTEKSARMIALPESPLLILPVGMRWH